jgi:hypothetical protein
VGQAGHEQEEEKWRREDRRGEKTGEHSASNRNLIIPIIPNKSGV